MTTIVPEQETTDVELVETLAPYDDTNDGKDHLTHIINPPMNSYHSWWVPSLNAQEIVNIARVFGEEVTALCGYRWVPKRNPENYPPCQQCFKIAEQLMAAEGE